MKNLTVLNLDLALLQIKIKRLEKEIQDLERLPRLSKDNLQKLMNLQLEKVSQKRAVRAMLENYLSQNAGSSGANRRVHFSLK